MLKLKSVRRELQWVEAVYEVTHSTPGRDGTTVSFDVKIRIDHDKSVSSIEVDGCDAATPIESLKRLAGWMRRLADGIDAHSGQITLPF